MNYFNETSNDIEFDSGIFHDMITVLGKEKFLIQYEKYIIEIDRYLIDFKEYLQNRDFKNLARKSHKAAGSSGMFGATGLMKNLYNLEKASKIQDFDEASNLIEKVNIDWICTQKIFQQNF